MSARVLPVSPKACHFYLARRWFDGSLASGQLGARVVLRALVRAGPLHFHRTFMQTMQNPQTRLYQPKPF